MTYSCNGAVRLIHVQAVDGPEGVFEGRGVVLHVVVAGVGEGGTVGAGGPGAAGPVAAEVGVEDLGGGVRVLVGDGSGGRRVVWGKGSGSRW